MPWALQRLVAVDKLIIKQKVELLEAFTGFETHNKYEIFNTGGVQIFRTEEQNDWCTLCCCGPNRPFEMSIMNEHGHEGLRLSRPFRCTCSCCFAYCCCLQKMDVFSPPGTLVGTVEQNVSCCNPTFSIKDEMGNTVLKLEGPVCVIECCNDVDFKLLTLDGNQIGRVSKNWSGFAKEFFTDAENFTVAFPRDLDAKVKATILGASLLVDFMYFEKTHNKENDGSIGF